MERFNEILSIINDQVLLTIIGIAFGIQLFYILLFFVRAKTYKKAEVKHKFGIVIPARNEAEVIGDTIKRLLKSDYPRELFDIFVVADNCTDNTAEIARAAGAIVYERSDPDPKHHRAGYALKYLFEKIRENHAGYEAFIKFDADNLMELDYISRMNDAFDAGVKCARGYSNSKNIDQNIITGISGLWYIRDCRFASNFRSAIGQGTMLGGAGMMFSAEIIEKHGGWDCLSASDDTEFTMRRLNEDKIKTMYVKDAVVYEDQPSTLKDTFKRYKRMARALNSLFYTQGIKSFFLFFARWKWTYIDMFLTLMFIPVCVMMCTWLPVYYIYVLVYHGIMGNWAIFWTYMNSILFSLAFAFVTMFILQALLAVALEHKRIKAPVKKLMPTVFLFPVFMIVYAAAITLGVFSKPKWHQVKRNVAVSSGLADASLAEAAATDGGATNDNASNESDLAQTSVPAEVTGETELAANADCDCTASAPEPKEGENAADGATVDNAGTDGE